MMLMFGASDGDDAVVSAARWMSSNVSIRQELILCMLMFGAVYHRWSCPARRRGRCQAEWCAFAAGREW